jgi:hypothetical protein
VELHLVSVGVDGGLELALLGLAALVEIEVGDLLEVFDAGLGGGDVEGGAGIGEAVDGVADLRDAAGGGHVDAFGVAEHGVCEELLDGGEAGGLGVVGAGRGDDAAALADECDFAGDGLVLLGLLFALEGVLELGAEVGEADLAVAHDEVDGGLNEHNADERGEADPEVGEEEEEEEGEDGPADEGAVEGLAREVGDLGVLVDPGEQAHPEEEDDQCDEYLPDADVAAPLDGGGQRQQGKGHLGSLVDAPWVDYYVSAQVYCGWAHLASLSGRGAVVAGCDCEALSRPANVNLPVFRQFLDCAGVR